MCGFLLRISSVNVTESAENFIFYEVVDIIFLLFLWTGHDFIHFVIISCLYKNWIFVFDKDFKSINDGYFTQSLKQMTCGIPRFKKRSWRIRLSGEGLSQCTKKWSFSLRMMISSFKCDQIRRKLKAGFYTIGTSVMKELQPNVLSFRPKSLFLPIS